MDAAMQRPGRSVIQVKERAGAKLQEENKISLFERQERSGPLEQDEILERKEKSGSS